MSISENIRSVSPRDFAPIVFGYAGAVVALWLYFGISYFFGDVPSLGERIALGFMTLSSMALTFWITQPRHYRSKRP
ncbi:MAG: hypothetical protein AAFO61_06295 [Pseudomonadota bacterium]